jgi:hypothetical protein
MSFAILSLIQRTLLPRLMMGPPKSLAVTFANWRHQDTQILAELFTVGRAVPLAEAKGVGVSGHHRGEA